MMRKRNRRRMRVSLNTLDHMRLKELLNKEGISETCMERFLGIPHRATTVSTPDGYGFLTKEKKDMVLKLIGRDKELLRELRELQKKMIYLDSENKSGDHVLITDELVENVDYLAKYYGLVERIPKEFNVSIATYRNILGRKFKYSHKNIADKIRKAVRQTKEEEMKKTVEKKEETKASEELLQQVPKMPVKETTFEEEAKKLDADERRWKKNLGTPEENIRRIMEATPRNEACLPKKVPSAVLKQEKAQKEEYELLKKNKAEVEDLFKEELKPEEVKAKEELEKAMKPERNLWMPSTFREALYFFENRRKETDDLDEILEMVKDMARTY